MVSLSVVALVVVAFAIYYYFSNKKERYPPGPIGLPFLGSLLSCGSRPHLAFHEWGKKYGGIFSVNMGINPAIVLTDAKLIREAFNESAFSGRVDNKAFNMVSGGKFGVISSDGESWLEQRRFTLRNLRDFGFGKKSMETLVMDEVQEVLNWMKKEEGQPVVLHRKFSLSVLNALWGILTGERYEPDDVKLTTILDTANTTFNELSKTGLAFFFPQLAEILPGISGWTKLVKVLGPFKAIFEDAVIEHETNPADEQHPRDFIDVYFNEIKKTTNPNSSFYKEAGRKSLVAVVGDLHGAGSETTAQTLTWSILYAVRHLQVQTKLHEEIDRVVGKSRFPSLDDRPEMRYAEAFIMEVLRFSCLVPMGVFHNTMNDVEFHGYKIPKDTMIISNIYSALFSTEAWGDPHNFRPERFLSPDGKTLIRNNEALIPFSTGKRACLGETLARDELFLFITSIFQRFDIRADPKNPNPTMEPNIGFLAAAKPFSVIMKDRIH